MTTADMSQVVSDDAEDAAPVIVGLCPLTSGVVSSPGGAAPEKSRQHPPAAAERLGGGKGKETSGGTEAKRQLPIREMEVAACEINEMVDTATAQQAPVTRAFSR